MKDVFVEEHNTINEALKKLNQSAEKVLLVLGKDKSLLGSLTDGDIRRFVLKGNKLDHAIRDAYNRDVTYIYKENYSSEKAKRILIEKKIELIPILNRKRKVVDYLTWNNAFSDEVRDRKKYTKIDTSVVIMAGGKGNRLKPFTDIFPKPLLPVGNRTMLEQITDHFSNYGITNYYLTLNYKGKMIKAYLNGLEKDYEVHYIWEPEYMGTAGSLKLIADDIEPDFIATNCDILVNADYAEVYNLHKENSAYMTMLSSIRYIGIPYGVIDFKEKGEVTGLTEKPEYTFTVNTGVYIINTKTLDFIPSNKYYDMNSLIESLLKAKKKVITYPVNEKDYLDVGQWSELKKVSEYFDKYYL